MAIKINYLNAKVFISNTDEDQSFLLSDIHDELIELEQDFFNKIDREHYLYHEFYDTEFANPIDTDGGFIEEPTQINIDILQINIYENLIDIVFRAEIHFELFFELRGKTYDSTDGCWEYHGGHIEKHYQEKITYQGMVKKHLSNDESFTLIVTDQDVHYPPLENYVKTTEMFDVSNQYLFKLITDSTFCPFDYFNKNMDMIQEELNSSITFNKSIMLYAHIVNCFEAYLLVRLSKLILTIPNLKAKLEENKNEFQKINNTEDILKKSFHNIDFLEKLLKLIFKIDIANEAPELKKIVALRNDCIHRAGMDSNQIPVSISYDSIITTQHFIKDFATTLDNTLATEFR